MAAIVSIHPPLPPCVPWKLVHSLPFSLQFNLGPRAAHIWQPCHAHDLAYVAVAVVSISWPPSSSDLFICRFIYPSPDSTRMLIWLIRIPRPDGHKWWTASPQLLLRLSMDAPFSFSVFCEKRPPFVLWTSFPFSSWNGSGQQYNCWPSAHLLYSAVAGTSLLFTSALMAICVCVQPIDNRTLFPLPLLPFSDDISDFTRVKYHKRPPQYFSRLLHIPLSHKRNFGDCCFSIYAPKIWRRTSVLFSATFLKWYLSDDALVW